MQYLYPHFLNDDAEYALAEAFWESLWNDIPEETHRQGNWHSKWFVPQLPRDGNPIFTAVSDVLNKGIRVIQYPPSSDVPELDFWMDVFGGAAIDPDAIDELVIACSLSMEAAARAQDLMAAWMGGAIEIINSGFTPFGFSNIRVASPAGWYEAPPQMHEPSHVT
ncbi:MAG: hypothetical protein ACHP8A_17390 [Terriglobales bacterium]